MCMLKMIIPFLFLYCFNLQAEYRVFLLKLSKPDGSFKEVQSTLDAYQYTQYYAIDPDVSVEYLDSWICLGYTGASTPYCLRPQKTSPVLDSKENNAQAPNELPPLRQ